MPESGAATSGTTGISTPLRMMAGAARKVLSRLRRFTGPPGEILREIVGE
jgi:hypothetical protein